MASSLHLSFKGKESLFDGDLSLCIEYYCIFFYCLGFDMNRNVSQNNELYEKLVRDNNLKSTDYDKRLGMTKKPLFLHLDATKVMARLLQFETEYNTCYTEPKIFSISLHKLICCT